MGDGGVVGFVVMMGGIDLFIMIDFVRGFLRFELLFLGLVVLKL